MCVINVSEIEYGRVWSHYMDTRAFINEHKIAPLKTVIEAYLLIKWL